jgi:hypothetical protein
MINPRLKNKMLRLDLLISCSVNGMANKIFYKYPMHPLRGLPNNYLNQVVIEKDTSLNILWFDRSFFQSIELYYQMSSLPFDELDVKHYFESNFFNDDEFIGQEHFNPAGFGKGMQIKVADEYARSFWDNLKINE